MSNKYYFDINYNKYIISNGYKLGYIISKEIDRGTIELVGPFGLSNNFYNTALNIAKLDTGIITTYSLYITIGLLALLLLVFTPMFASFFSSTIENNIVFAGATDANNSLLMELRLVIIYLASSFIILKNK